jgi:hypothetical protein
MAPLARLRQALDVAAGQALDADLSPCGLSRRRGYWILPLGFSRLDIGGLPNLRTILVIVVFALVAGFLEVVLQLLLGVPPALADGSHLLGGGCSVGVLVRTKVAWISSA